MKEQFPRKLDRWALGLMIVFSFLSVGYWAFRIGTDDFGEPWQIAQVGHFAPWRTLGKNKRVVAVGTDRHFNDIVLHDRKASPKHFILERRGGEGNWRAILRNRTVERRILIKKASGRIFKINRYRFSNGVVELGFPLKEGKDSSKDLRKDDKCSPSKLLSFLRLQTFKVEKNISSASADQSSLKWASFEVRVKRFPPIIRSEEQLYLTREFRGHRQRVRLIESRRYRLPSSLGHYLEFQRGHWYYKKGKKLHRFEGPFVWKVEKGKKKLQGFYRLEKVIVPLQWTLAPQYFLKQVGKSCEFPLRSESIQQSLEIGDIAKLYFFKKYLFLQHLGRVDLSVKIFSNGKENRELGIGTVEDGDYIFAGQLVYKVHLNRDGVRLMLVPNPSRHFFLPGFKENPSYHYPMKRVLLSHHPLMVSGGRGVKGVFDKWIVRTSFLGQWIQNQQGDPSNSLFILQKENEHTVTLKPLKGTLFHQADLSGKIIGQQLTKAFVVDPDKLYYARRFYFRIFRPSYFGLSWWLVVCWVLVFGGVLGLLYWVVMTGRLRLSPIPSDEVLEHLTASDDPRRMLLREKLFSKLTWAWLPFTLLLPMAIFLNGLGIYVLAHLSLSSLALNNNSFLYRQFLWSLVGIVIFFFVIWVDEWNWSLIRRLGKTSWKWVKARLIKWNLLSPKKPLKIIQSEREEVFAPKKKPNLFIYFVLYLGLVLLFYFFLHAQLPFGFFFIFIIFLFFLFLYWYLIRLYLYKNDGNPIAQRNITYNWLAIFLLAAVPIVGLIFPPLVHNHFFLKLGPLGTVKLSEFAIIAAIHLFAGFLGLEIFELRFIKAHRFQEAKEQKVGGSFGKYMNVFWGAFLLFIFYLMLLGSIWALYTVQGDLGPALILTLAFSLYILFTSMIPAATKLVTWMRFLVFFSFLGIVIGMSFQLSFSPEVAQHFSQLRKIVERVSLWNQPWRFMVGEQLLQNQWNLAAYNDAFQWFNNLHSDFVFTAVVRVLSPFWGYFIIVVTALFPVLTFGLTWLHLLPLNSEVTAKNIEGQKGMRAWRQYHREQYIRALIMLFGSLYLFSQNFIHIGSVLGVTPMTGVTLTWISSGGTSLVACYIVLGVIYRQMRHHSLERGEGR